MEAGKIHRTKDGMTRQWLFLTVPADFKKETLCLTNALNLQRSRSGERNLRALTRGKLTSSGRAGHLLPDVNKRRLADYIAWSKEYGIAFHYIFNSTCLGNLEFTQIGRRKIKRFLDELYELGVRSVTVRCRLCWKCCKSIIPKWNCAHPSHLRRGFTQ